MLMLKIMIKNIVAEVPKISSWRHLAWSENKWRYPYPIEYMRPKGIAYRGELWTRWKNSLNGWTGPLNAKKSSLISYDRLRSSK